MDVFVDSRNNQNKTYKFMFVLKRDGKNEPVMFDKMIESEGNIREKCISCTAGPAKKILIVEQFFHQS